MDEILYCICQHKVDIMGGYIPISSTVIARCTKLSIGKVKYRLKKLKEQGLIIADSYGSSTEDGEPFCIHGYTITEKAKHTDEYKQAWAQERQLCKDTLDIDIGEVDAANSTQPYCDHCGTEFNMKVRKLDD